MSHDIYDQYVLKVKQGDIKGSSSNMSEFLSSFRRKKLEPETFQYKNDALQLINLKHKLVQLFCQQNGNITKIASILKKKSISGVCRQLTPILLKVLKKMEDDIIQRKIRKIYIKWTDYEIKRFLVKFYEIKNGKLYGADRRVPLQILYKLLRQTYDKQIQLNDMQLNQMYNACLDLNLAIDQQQQFSLHKNDEKWNLEEDIKFAKLMLRTNNFQEISDHLRAEFGFDDKFQISKLYSKVDTTLRASMLKIKNSCMKNTALKTLQKIDRSDISNVNYGLNQVFMKVRKVLLQYFIVIDPNYEQTEQVINVLNNFITQCQQFRDSKKQKQVKQTYCKIQKSMNQVYTLHQYEKLKVQQALSDPDLMVKPKSQIPMKSSLKPSKLIYSGQKQEKLEKKIQKMREYEQKMALNKKKNPQKPSELNLMSYEVQIQSVESKDIQQVLQEWGKKVNNHTSYHPWQLQIESSVAQSEVAQRQSQIDTQDEQKIINLNELSQSCSSSIFQEESSSIGSISSSYENKFFSGQCFGCNDSDAYHAELLEQQERNQFKEEKLLNKMHKKKKIIGKKKLMR